MVFEWTIKEKNYEGMNYQGGLELPLPLGQAWGSNGKRGITILFLNCIEHNVSIHDIDHWLYAVSRYFTSKADGKEPLKYLENQMKRGGKIFKHTPITRDHENDLDPQ